MRRHLAPRACCAIHAPGLGQNLHAGLGNIVGRVAGRRGDALLGTGVDDGARAILLDHGGGESLDAIDHAPEVRFQNGAASARGSPRTARRPPCRHCSSARRPRRMPHRPCPRRSTSSRRLTSAATARTLSAFPATPATSSGLRWSASPSRSARQTSCRDPQALGGRKPDAAGRSGDDGNAVRGDCWMLRPSLRSLVSASEPMRFRNGPKLAHLGSFAKARSRMDGMRLRPDARWKKKGPASLRGFGGNLIIPRPAISEAGHWSRSLPRRRGTDRPPACRGGFSCAGPRISSGSWCGSRGRSREHPE